MLPHWDAEEAEIFYKSSQLHFRVPFNGVQVDDKIEIDCEYVESLPLVQGYYYLRIPLFFVDWELRRRTLEIPEEQIMTAQHSTATMEKTFFEQRVKVHCRINHSNSMNVKVTWFFFLRLLYLGYVAFLFCFSIFIVLGLEMSIKHYEKYNDRE